MRLGRLIARKSNDADQVRRLLALAVIYDGGSRTQAAELGGVTLQVVRDWVLRFNAHGPEGLVDREAPGQPSLLDDAQRAVLAAMLENGAIPAVHNVIRWRIVDLCQWTWEEYEISVSKQTLSLELRAWAIASCWHAHAIMRRRRAPSRHSKTYGPPRLEMDLKMVLKVCANVSGLTSIARSQDGDPRALVFTKVSEWLAASRSALADRRPRQRRALPSLHVEKVLLPTLRPSDIVVRDNLGSHRGKALRRVIRSVGARLLFLPNTHPT